MVGNIFWSKLDNTVYIILQIKLHNLTIWLIDLKLYLTSFKEFAVVIWLLYLLSGAHFLQIFFSSCLGWWSIQLSELICLCYLDFQSCLLSLLRGSQPSLGGPYIDTNPVHIHGLQSQLQALIKFTLIPLIPFSYKPIAFPRHTHTDPVCHVLSILSCSNSCS